MFEEVILTVVQGSLEGREYIFDQKTQCVLGRADDCDIRLPRDPGPLDVSRHHCELEVDPPNIRIRDLGSLHGTYVNCELIGQRPHDQDSETIDLRSGKSRELKAGDEIRVGNTVLRVGVGVAAGALQLT
jgi:pSer/pThr/pTyr-binding forkhead associated (FHA) protein